MFRRTRCSGGKEYTIAFRFQKAMGYSESLESCRWPLVKMHSATNQKAFCSTKPHQMSRQQHVLIPDVGRTNPYQGPSLSPQLSFGACTNNTLEENSSLDLYVG
ncbi:hypothetical protein AAC387_Pa05g1885 [Persea americana]